MVFVLDRHKQPLMPCTPKRARLLLARGRAVVHRIKPFVIRLRDRCVEDSVLQESVLKIDPWQQNQWHDPGASRRDARGGGASCALLLRSAASRGVRPSRQTDPKPGPAAQ